MFKNILILILFCSTAFLLLYDFDDKALDCPTGYAVKYGGDIYLECDSLREFVKTGRSIHETDYFYMTSVVGINKPGGER